MIYNQHAFDNFDVLCCVGPHHFKEARLLETLNKSSKKKLLKFGYRNLISSYVYNQGYKKNKKKKYQKILIAPSWGKTGLIESGRALELIRSFLRMKIKVILRPHPETFIRFPYKINRIISEFNNCKNFVLDCEISAFNSMEKSDALLTDWSGTSMEYAFGFRKPVIFCDIDKKINNISYTKLRIEPVEISVREKIGIIWDMDFNLNVMLKKLSSFDFSKIDIAFKNLIFSDLNVKTNLSVFLKSYQSSKRKTFIKN